MKMAHVIDCSCNSEYPVYDNVVIELEVTKELKDYIRKVKSQYDNAKSAIGESLHSMTFWSGWATFKAPEEEEARFEAHTLIVISDYIAFSAYAKHTDDPYVSNEISIQEILDDNDS